MLPTRSIKYQNNIGLSYLPNAEVFQKSLEKAVNIFTQGYIHEIKVYGSIPNVNLSCKCYPSMGEFSESTSN